MATGKAASLMQTKFTQIVSALSLLAGILMIVAGVPAMAVMEKATGAGIMLVAVLVGRLHQVEEFSLGPLKARLRATIEEANATIQQLRGVALGLAEASLTDLMAGNFMDSMHMGQRLAMHDVIVKSLVVLGMSQADVQKASVHWNKGIGLTYWRAIRGSLPQVSDPNVRSDPKIRLAFDSLMDFKEWRAPTPDEAEAFVKERDLENPAVAEWIADYRHFIRTKEIRRRDEFAKQ